MLATSPIAQTLERAAERKCVAVRRTSDGPIVAAVGGIDPQSVLRTARMLAPPATEVIAVTALAPLPVTETAEGTWIVPASHEERRSAEATVELAHRIHAFGPGAKSWRRDVIHGEPARAITNFAEEVLASLLIVGIGRHGPLDHILVAESALGAVGHARCPVLIVHPDLKAPFRQIVVATDFSTRSAAAARALVPLLHSGATVHVVHVVHEWEPSAVTDSRLAAADEAYVKSLPDRFRRFLGAVGLPDDVTVRTATRAGKPAERILDYARTHDADLIVAGRHGRNMLQRTLVGSETTALVRGAEQSLLVVSDLGA